MDPQAFGNRLGWLALAALVGGAILAWPRSAPHPPNPQLREIGAETAADLEQGRTTEQTQADREPAAEPAAIERPEPPISGLTPVPSGTNWYEGAYGFESAVAEARAGNYPMVVYFYTDWCPYCRDFRTKLLESDPVTAYLRGAVKVRINAEDGADEEALARSYDASKIPAFFILPTPDSPVQRISRWHDLPDGGNRLQTPEEFVETCRNTIGG